MHGDTGHPTKIKVLTVIIESQEYHTDGRMRPLVRLAANNLNGMERNEGQGIVKKM